MTITTDKEGYLALKNYLLKCVSEKEVAAFQPPKKKQINNNNVDDDTDEYYDMACEARGQVSYALQFEESAGLLPAADAYATAHKLLQSAIVLCTDDSNTAVLQQFAKLVEKRIQTIHQTKETKQQKTVQLEKKKKSPAVRKWAKHYKDSRGEKKVNRNQTLRSIKQVSYGAVSKKVVSHFQAYSQDNMEHADVRKIKYSTIRVSQPQTMGVGITSSGVDPAFTVWFSSHNKNYKLSIETLHCYSSTLRTILISATTPSQQDDYIELIKRAFKIDLPTHESLLLAIQKEFQANGPTAVAAKELEMRLKILDDHQFYSKHSFRSKEDFEIWRSQEQEQIKKLMGQLGISESDKNHHPQRTQQHKHVLDIFGSSDSTDLPVVITESKLKNSGNNNNAIKEAKNNKLPLDYHKMYLLLASNLIKYDSNHAHEISQRDKPPPQDKKEKKKKNVEAPPSSPSKALPKSRSELDLVNLPTEIAPLSEMSKWVLEHFSELYGIGKIYTKIVYFDILCQSFDHTMHHMGLIANTLQEISQLLSMRNLVKLTKQEVELLQTSTRILFAHIQQRVETFPTCFPMASSKSKGSSKKSLELFRFMIDKVLINLMSLDKTIGDQYEGLIIECTVKELMVSAVKKKVEKDFNYMVLRADRILETEHKDSVIGSMNEDKLLMLLDFIVEEIAANIEPYLPLFEQHCKFGEIVVSDFYDHFFGDLERFCDVANQNNALKLTPDFFEMIKKTREFTALCFKAVPQLSQHDLSRCFEPFIVRWITETHVRLEQWTMEAYDLDKLEVVDKTQPYSSSVIDLFCLITSPLQVLKDVLDLQTDDRFVQIYSVIIHKLVEKYVDKVYCTCVQDIPVDTVMQLNSFVENISKSISQRTPILKRKNASELLKENLKRFSSNFTRAFNSSPSNNNNSTDNKAQIRKEIDKYMCILANNVEASRIMLEDVDTEFGHNFGEYLGPSFEYLKACSHKMLGSMIYRMNFYLKPQLAKIVDLKAYLQFKQSCKEKGVQCMAEDLPAVRELFEYLDTQLEMCSDNFLPSNFMRMLKLLWETLMNDIVEMLTPADPTFSLTPEQALILEELLEPFILFFNANDCGLKLQFLEEGSCAFIRGLVGLIEVETEALILLYKALADQQPILKKDRRADLIFTSNHILNLLAGRKEREAQAFVKQELKRKEQK